jgi:hypothetical protein
MRAQARVRGATFVLKLRPLFGIYGFGGERAKIIEPAEAVGDGRRVNGESPGTCNCSVVEGTLTGLPNRAPWDSGLRALWVLRDAHARVGDLGRV